MKIHKAKFAVPVSANHPAPNLIRQHAPELYERLDCGNPDCPDPSCKGTLICETEARFFHEQVRVSNRTVQEEFDAFVTRALVSAAVVVAVVAVILEVLR